MSNEIEVFVDTQYTDGKNINIKHCYEYNTLRCALEWEVEKRVRSLFSSYDEYRKTITELFVENYLNKKIEFLKLEVESFKAKTGVAFTINIPRNKFILYSADEWTTQIVEKTVPVDTELLAKLENGKYLVVKLHSWIKEKDRFPVPVWVYSHIGTPVREKIVAVKACE